MLNCNIQLIPVQTDPGRSKDLWPLSDHRVSEVTCPLVSVF